MTIDWWTLGIQAVNVLVLVGLLGHFFWKPVAAMVELRRVTAGQMLAQAKAREDEVAKAVADVEHTRAGFAREREAVLAQALADANVAKVALLEDAAKTAAALVDGAKDALEKAQASADVAWRERATQLAIEIASRLCAHLAGAAAQTVFLDRLIDKIRSLPEPERRALAEPGTVIDAVSPSPLTPADEDRARERIAAVFGNARQITFHTDPSLIAGIELRSAHLEVSNSWRADLRHIRDELSHDDLA